MLSLKSTFLILKSAVCITFVAVGSVVYAQAMTTPAQFSVNESGAATYTVPIQVPLGINDMEPELALNYNSQGGNGLMGMGWSLSGLSSISRCPKTVVQDGVRSVVDFSPSDRFCLDGQRLMRVDAMGASNTTTNADSVYATADSEYRTENDVFSKIVFLGFGGGFQVKTKSGLVMEYGFTADSRVWFSGNPTSHVWALSKVTDVSGNFMTISYVDPSNADFRVSQINYTGNGAHSPVNKVMFDYDSARSDISPSYVFGLKTALTKRLVAVNTYAGSTLVKKYNIAYLPQSGVTDRLNVTTVTECAPFDKCLPSIRFSSNRNVFSGFKKQVNLLPSYGAGPSAGGWSSPLFLRRVLDVNNDGYGDIVGFGHSAVSVTFGRAGGVFTESKLASTEFVVATGWNDNDKLPRHLIDMNSDGLPDIVGFDSQGCVVALNKGDGTFYPMTRWSSEFGGWPESIHPRQLADINGDGFPDIVGFANDGVKLALNTGKNSFSPAIHILSLGTGNVENPDQRPRYLVDINGDGLPDLLVFHRDGIKAFFNKNGIFQEPWVHVGEGNNFGSDLGWVSSEKTPRYVLDVNNDGFADILGFASDGVYVALNNGKGRFLPQTRWADDFGINNNWTESIYPRFVVDINADGLIDIVGFSHYGVKVSLNTGRESFSPSVLLLKSYGVDVSAGQWGNNTAVPRNVVDLNGDNIPDIIGFSTTGTEASFNALEGQPYELAEILNDSHKIGITFNTLLNSGINVYTKDSAANGNQAIYPKTDLIMPMQVVSRVFTSNGVGGLNTIDYTYGGLKAQVGRGILGFRWIKSKENATGLETYTEYRQDYPYIGMVAKSETRLAGMGNGGLLKQTSHTYQCKVPATGADCSVPPENCLITANTPACISASQARRFVYSANTKDASWDLNGAAFTVNSTETLYGINSGDSQLFGDPTTISVSDGVGNVKTTINTYFPAKISNGNWILGRLKSAKVTSTAPDKR
jgi:Salmonella virulence plasmid 65kDa B protein/FG-GAP-like repeat